MKTWSVAAAVWAGLTLAGAAEAETVSVGQLSEGPAVAQQFTTIIEAVAAARAPGSNITEILVARRDTPYTDGFTLVPGVVIRGEETANTTLSGVINGIDDGVLRNFKVTGRVDLDRVQRITVENNLFVPTADAPALRVDTEPFPEEILTSGTIVIRDNTFFRPDSRGVAIEVKLPQSLLQIHNNVFVGFATAVDFVSGIPANVAVEANVFFGNATNVGRLTVPPSAGNLQEDPLFVSQPEDLHVKAQSPACDAGAFATTSTTADRTPPPVAVGWRRVGETVQVFWTAAQACGRTRVYRVFAADAAGGERVEVAGPQAGATFTVTAANPAPRPAPVPPAVQPAASPPTGLVLSPRSGAIHAAWSPGAEAVDGFRVEWSADGTATPPAVVFRDRPAANQPAPTQFTIEGLQNNVVYRVSVTSYLSDFRFFTVTAEDADAAAVGVASRTQAETKVPVRPLDESSPIEATETPEELMAVPDLQNNGLCFLQTTAGNAPRFPWLPAALALGTAAALRRRLSTFSGVLLLVSAGLLLASPARAAEPRWVFGVMGGAVEPATEDFGTQFDRKRLPAGKTNLGYRLFPVLELGVEAGYWRAKGEAATTVSGRPVTPAANETLSIVPLQAYALLNFQFADRQWLVPYAGGGYSRYYYRQAIEGQDDSKGHLEGYHFRGGLKFLLNDLDPMSARRANAYFDLKRTFLALEAQWAKVDDFGDADADLGGLSYYGGLILEF